jgi:hypothetical protein
MRIHAPSIVIVASRKQKHTRRFSAVIVTGQHDLQIMMHAHATGGGFPGLRQLLLSSCRVEDASFIMYS